MLNLVVRKETARVQKVKLRLACTAKAYAYCILEVKNSEVKSLHYVTECTICNMVADQQTKDF